ncbi:uncharacterized protein LOC111705737 [Eurytemora carolleeae]|uniref:uncharacterized protein LOC111705737 n=1 Tax=Eurytemora carolleeae TaxID=1294199 RepID=UPI000C77F16D|nr:uncharacterized protein LOC111705737 [Eurytemora carolleeae]|eukprot:XP_023334152.1 uncharacterized protein LOC111705737 [Eurytemora affinis]
MQLMPTRHSEVPTQHSKVPIRHSEVPTRDWDVAHPINIVRKKSLEEIQGKSYIIQREENGKQIFRFHIIVTSCGFLSCLITTIWDLSAGNQHITGRCVWASFCIWISTLSCSCVCLFLLFVNILGLSGIYKASSWSETRPYNSYRFLYIWLIVYFLVDISVLPICIYFLYAWFMLKKSYTVLHIGIPIVGVVCLSGYLVLIHHWFRILNLTQQISKLSFIFSCSLYPLDRGKTASIVRILIL